MAPHSSTLAWKIPWMEEPGRLQSMGLLGSDTTEQLHFHFSLSCIGEGNGNPLQCSCLENLRNGGAWWAAFSGFAESDTTDAPQQQQQQCKNGCFKGLLSRKAILLQAFQIAQIVKNPPVMWETWVQSLGREDPLEKEMATISVFSPGEFHGQRSLASYSSKDHKESGTTE